jgi:predicted PurR-regulated permease PerM
MTAPSEGQTRILWLAATGLAIAVLVGLLAGLIWGLGRVVGLLSPVLGPLAVAGVLAYLLDPVVDFLERKGTARPRAIILVFALTFIIFAGLLSSVVPQLIVETRQLVSRVPEYADRLEKKVQGWVSHPPAWLRTALQSKPGGAGETNAPPSTNDFGADQVDLTTRPSPKTNAPPLLSLFDKDTLQTAATGLAGGVRRAAPWLFGRVVSWVGVLAGLALIPVYAFYFLLEKRGISSRWTDYLPVSDSGFKNELVFVLTSINSYLIAFFRGQVLVAICDGLLYGMGFLLIGLPYSLLIGAAAILLTMIPFLGAMVICAMALVIAVVTFGDWAHPLLVLAVFGVVQTLEGLLISPKIMGDKVGLHPLTIIVAVMVGTTLLGGLLGGILAIPLTAALRVIMARYIWKRQVAVTAGP